MSNDGPGFEARLVAACDELIEKRELELRLRQEIKLLQLENGLAARAVDSLVKMSEDLGVQHAFWKSAAERALRLWDDVQDENEKIRDAIEVTLSSSSTSLSHANWTRLETVLDE